MKIAAVVDRACLIGLERIGRLDLLPALLDALDVNHFRIGSALQDEALRLAGE